MNRDEIHLASFPFGGSAGMKLRLHKLATVHARNVVRRLGTLPRATSREVKERLRSLLEL